MEGIGLGDGVLSSEMSMPGRYCQDGGFASKAIFVLSLFLCPLVRREKAHCGTRRLSNGSPV
jgi:hypothetical protein